MTDDKVSRDRRAGRAAPEAGATNFRHMIEMPTGVCLAFTDVATGNLGLHVPGASDPQDNRRALEASMGVEPGTLLFLEQVHGTRVVQAEDTPLLSPGLSADEERSLAPTADAAVTTTGRPLAIMTADCLPVVITTSDSRTYGVAHAGRQGLLTGVLPNVVAELRAKGAQDLEAWIGPAICGSCYEVPQDMADGAEAEHPGIAVTTRWGSPGLDLPGAADRQLKQSGVLVHRDVVNECTFENDELFSHRRAPGQGRIAGLVWARPRSNEASRAEAPGR
ncbi:polyphenol oxidase family protein [Curtobacterium sp. S6]|uniref:polyphenol oxidase family protein n=1 Tax=Curtobacterium sp. S6 TaxID=1479623 RepID=UPI000A456913|nr:polyphenol oxidase family protein [Curtobacterium sp. S6]